MPKPILIATRGSALALAQANWVLAQCQTACPDLPFELRIVRTTGDKHATASLDDAELPKGIFTKEIEEALWSGEADLAVHSLKDLPTDLPAGLQLGAVSPRADVRDVLIYRDIEYLVSNLDWTQPAPVHKRGYKPSLSVNALPCGAAVGTGSPRRSAQLLERRPDLKVVPLRGNVGTRLKKLSEQAELDAVVLAAAGLERLNIRVAPSGLLQGEDVPPGLAATPLSLSEMLPCVGQAALGIEIRAHDQRMASLCEKIDHAPTHRCVAAERAFLKAMGGGCHLSVAAYAELDGEELRLRAVSFLNEKARRGEIRGGANEAEQLGQRLAAELKK